MAVAFVQNASGSTTGAANPAATFGSPPTQNNLLTAQLFTKADTGVTNPVGLSTAIDVVNGPAADTLRLAYKVAGAAESSTIQFTVAADNSALGTFEFSGTATTSPLDKTASTALTAGATSLSSGTPATTSQADEVSVAAFGFRGVPTTPTLDSSFNKKNVVDSGGAAQADLVDGYRIETATGTPNTNCAWTGALDTMGALATFKGLAAATDGRSASIAIRPGGIGPMMRRSLPQRYPDSPVELTKSPAAPFRPGRGPGMAPMSLRRNIVWPSATFSPDVTLALTGVQAAGAVGTLGVTLDVGLTGNAATGAVGTLTPGTTLALTGVAGTGSVGTMAPSTDVAMTGVAGTGSVGTLAPSTTVTLSGNEATVTIGTLSPSGDVTVALTGVSASALVGDLSPSGGDVVVGAVDTGSGGGSSLTFDEWLARHPWLRDYELRPNWYAYPPEKKKLKKQILAAAKERKRVSQQLSFAKDRSELDKLLEILNTLQERYNALQELYRAGLAVWQQSRAAEAEEEAEFMEHLINLL